MSYIGKKAKEQYSGRVLLQEFHITSNTAFVEINEALMSGGSKYRVHEIEFVAMQFNSNWDFCFQLKRQGWRAHSDYNFTDESPNYDGNRGYYREEVSAAQAQVWMNTTGSNQGSAWSYDCPGWYNPRHQNEVDGGGATVYKDWISMTQYSAKSYENKTCSGRLVLFNLCSNDDRTRWYSEIFGQRHAGSSYQGQMVANAFGQTKYTDRIRRIQLRADGGALMTSGRIRVYGYAKSGGDTLNDGSTPNRAAESATELWENGVTEEGPYWISNLYTSHIPRLSYCKFNMNSEGGSHGSSHDYGGGEGQTSPYHMQKWSPRFLPDFTVNGDYGSAGSSTVADGSEIESTMDSSGGGSTAVNYSVYKSTGTGTQSGGKVTMKTGLLQRQISGHTLFSHRYLASTGSGTWDMEWMLDRHSTSSYGGGNYGNNYGNRSTETNAGGNAIKLHTFNAGISNTGSHRISRIIFDDDGYSRLAAIDHATNFSNSNFGVAHTYGQPVSTMWENVKKWDTLDPSSDNAAEDENAYGGWEQSWWIALSIKAATSSSEGKGYFEFWVHIP